MEAASRRHPRQRPHPSLGRVWLVGAKYHTDSKLFSFTGQFAITLKQLLPPHISVLTNTNPEIKSKYEKNFRALFVQDGSGRGLMFNCSSADLNFSDGGKPSIVEKPETSCSVGILSSQDSQEIPQDKIPVKDALQKATQANQLK